MYFPAWQAVKEEETHTHEEYQSLTHDYLQIMNLLGICASFKNGEKHIMIIIQAVTRQVQ